MKKNDKYILLAIVGVLIAFCSYQFVYKNNITEAETIKADSETLQLELDKLEELNSSKQEYLDLTESMKMDCSDIIDRFPGGLLTEDEVMYYNNMELERLNQISVAAIQMDPATEFPYVGETTVGEYEIQDDGILMYDAKTGINLATTYNGLKNVVRYIYEQPGRKSIQEVELAVDEDGHLVGTMGVDFYYLKGTPLLYTPTNIPPLPLGVDNIFGALEGSIGTDSAEDDETVDTVDSEETDDEE